MSLRTVAPALVAGLIMVPASAEAQRRAGPDLPVRAGEGVAFIGGSSLDLAELNARFEAHGYPTFSEQFLQLGLGLTSVRDRFLLGVDFAGLLRPGGATDDDQYRVRLGGGYAMLNLGYDILRQGGLAVRPKAGVGVGGLALRISDRAAPTFDQILQQPGRDVHIGSASLLLDGSLGVRYRFAPRPTTRGARALLLGARAGYTQSLLHSEWMRERGDVPGGPTAGWGGPHFEFMIGRTLRR
jgi:hypothetical protein